MKAVVFEAAGSQALRGGSLTGAAERTGGAESHIVEQDDEYVGRAFGRAQLLDGRIFGVRIFRVVSDQAGPGPIGDREAGTRPVILWTHRACPFTAAVIEAEIDLETGKLDLRPESRQ